MNYLVLGGNGYIGSKVVCKLIQDGNTVVSTRRKDSDLSRLGELRESVKWISASTADVEAALQEIPFDYVLNMVCNYGRSDILYDDVINANIEFPLRVLNSAVKSGVKKYLTIGTGLPDSFNMYSFSKKMFSEFGRFYCEKHNITFTSLLLQMFYGYDEPGNRFLPALIKKMLNGDTVNTTIGIQKRDIVAAEDIVKAIMLVIHSEIEGFHEVPVGTGVAPTISEIVDYIWENTGRKSEVLKGTVPMRVNEPDCIADTAMLSQLGNWNPIPWQKGILEMIKKMEAEA